MSAMASQITSVSIVYSTVYSGVDQRKYQSSASLASVSRIHRWQVNYPHKGSVTQKMFPFDDVIMSMLNYTFIYFSTDSKAPPSQWEMSLQINPVSHWLGTDIGSALYLLTRICHMTCDWLETCIPWAWTNCHFFFEQLKWCCPV